MKNLVWLLTILFTSLFMALFSQNVFAQHSEFTIATLIANQGTSKYKLTPKKGSVNVLEKYRVFENHQEKNSVWLSYIASFDGEFNLLADPGLNKLTCAVFNTSSNSASSDVINGKAEILRVLVGTQPGAIGLTKSEELGTNNKLYPVKLKKGQEILIYLSTDNLSLRDISMKIWQESDAKDDENLVLESKVIDMRADDFLNLLHIKIRDAESGLPLVASVNISGIKSISNYYIASDLFFDVEKSKKIEVKCDANGYFFFFKEFQVNDDVDNEIIVLLEPLSEGKKLGLPEIQFEMGTSNPTGNAIQLMDRLAEFLLSNPNVKIEIQGHVNETGENSLAAKKISEARAKRVYQYLIDKGVNKYRLEYKGMGNTEMIYPMPKNHYEEQANRRVEIKIL